MRHFGRFLLIVLALCSLPGSAISENGNRPPDKAGRNEENRWKPLDDAGREQFLLAGFCPYIAYRKPFRSGELAYVRTLEFADSLYSVANGTSNYSPGEIPPGWMSIAYNWWTHVAMEEGPRIRISPVADLPHRAGGEDRTERGPYGIAVVSPTGQVIDPEQIGRNGESCSTSLLFRASLEYRARSGRPEMKLVYPHQVRMAIDRLDESIRAKVGMARILAGRGDAISAKIASAERMGAGTCQPQKLSLAREELDRARHLALDIRYDPMETDESFTMAEATAEGILAIQKIASSRGLICYRP